MAVYDYECPGDGKKIEIKRGMTEPEATYYCPVCGDILRRIYNAAPFKPSPGMYSYKG